MTPDEIAEIFARLDAFEARCARLERLIYIGLGLALGSGALQLSQVVV